MVPTKSRRNIKATVGATKCQAKNERPKRRRAGLTDLSNAITSTLHIGGKADANESEEQPEKADSDPVDAVREKVTSSCGKKGDLEIASENHPVYEDNVKVNEDNENAGEDGDDEDAVEVAVEEHGRVVENEEEAGIVVEETDMGVIEAEWTVNETEIEEHLKDRIKGWNPAPVFDYDESNRGDPFEVPEYAMDIFTYYHYREIRFRPLDYMLRHPKLKKVRRAKIVDWFVRCQEGFEVNHEVLYHAVKLLDLYFCLRRNAEEFDYIGAAAMIIAAKVDHQDPPTVDDFVNLTNSQKYKKVNAYERDILRALNCDINFPLSYRFLRRFSKAAGVDMLTLTLARYILETSLLFYEFICVPDSLMAAAALLLALRMGQTGDWSPQLAKYSGYRVGRVEPLMWHLNHMMSMRKIVFPTCSSIEEKYSHGIFYRVADVPLLPDMFPRNEPVGPPADLDFRSIVL